MPTGYSNYCTLTRSITPSSPETVKWVWIIRDQEPLKWFRKELLRVQDRLGEIDIYITRLDSKDHVIPVSSNELADSSDQENISSDKKVIVSSNETTQENSSDTDTTDTADTLCIFKELKHVNIYYGRPDIQTLLISEIQNNSNNSTAILSCGPPKMNDEIRTTIARNLDMSSSRIDYFEEAQVWS